MLVGVQTIELMKKMTTFAYVVGAILIISGITIALVFTLLPSSSTEKTTMTTKQTSGATLCLVLLVF